MHFLSEKVLNLTSMPGDAGVLKWDLALLLLFSWILVYFCCFRGIQWTGKVIYHYILLKICHVARL